MFLLKRRGSFESPPGTFVLLFFLEEDD